MVVGESISLLTFDNGTTHIVHLMQGGRLRPDAKQSAEPRGGLCRWVFDSDEAWLLTEAGTERRAGVWVVDGDPLVQPPLDYLGPEADTITLTQLRAMCSANSRRLHGLLRSQKDIAGIGRLLANEICFAAKISPFANAAKLSDQRSKTLHAATKAVLKSALTQERTLDDIGKSADRPSNVHNRVGESCPVCDDVVRTVEYRKYIVFYCATCQTNGKVLADNTTSKFLR
ncbi:MAG: hypothetical protein R2706_14930 [Acidimicrobiales bacterium]